MSLSSLFIEKVEFEYQNAFNIEDQVVKFFSQVMTSTNSWF